MKSLSSKWSLRSCSKKASTSKHCTTFNGKDLRSKSLIRKAPSSEDRATLDMKALSSRVCTSRYRMALSSKVCIGCDGLALSSKSHTKKVRSSKDCTTSKKKGLSSRLSLKPCIRKASSSKGCRTSSRKVSSSKHVGLRLHLADNSSPKDWNLATFPDRISNLPPDVLSQIFSLLPTKDAAVISLLSKDLRSAFYRVTNIDIDDSPISHCSTQSCFPERFPAFVSFVNSVVRVVSHFDHHLSRFRLRVGGGVKKDNNPGSWFGHKCSLCCFPNLEPTLVNTWITLPLTHRVRELDLYIRMKEPAQLPLSIFTCETLEVLRLDVNLGVDQVSTMPFFHLPNLKVLHLAAFLISEDAFLTRLVSRCPLLADLNVRCKWKHADSIIISSPSLRKLHLVIIKDDYGKIGDVLRIDTPNLEDFLFSGILACHVKVTNMKALVKATIRIDNYLQNDPKGSFTAMLSLMKPMSNVQHLSLLSMSLEALRSDHLEGELARLPVFPNLRNLELVDSGYTLWCKVLLPFLRCSPSLETLAFPRGVSDGSFRHYHSSEVSELELQFCRTTQSIPCCRSHLRKIVIQGYLGSERELEMIKFLLRNAVVLEKLVVSCLTKGSEENLVSLVRSLEELPRASVSCSIEVLTVEFLYYQAVGVNIQGHCINIC